MRGFSIGAVMSGIVLVLVGCGSDGGNGPQSLDISGLGSAPRDSESRWITWSMGVHRRSSDSTWPSSRWS
jgi:hypothetical protein